MTPRVLLALDPGITTGWAMWTPEGITSGSISCKIGRYEKKDRRFVKFKGLLAEFKWMTRSIDKVYFEEVRKYRGLPNDLGFIPVLITWCEEHKIPYQGVSAGIVRRFISGKGNASKQDMRGCIQALGHVAASEKETDALALLHWAMRQDHLNITRQSL